MVALAMAGRPNLDIGGPAPARPLPDLPGGTPRQDGDLDGDDTVLHHLQLSRDGVRDVEEATVVQGFEGNPVVDPKLYFAVVVRSRCSGPSGCCSGQTPRSFHAAGNTPCSPPNARRSEELDLDAASQAAIFAGNFNRVFGGGASPPGGILAQGRGRGAPVAPPGPRAGSVADGATTAK